MKSNRDVAREIEKVTNLETLLKKQAEDFNRPPPPRSAPATDMGMNTTNSTITRMLESQSGARRSFLNTHPRVSDIDSPDTLKEEINHLQHALIDKFKGNQKLVSGAQFRSGGRDPGRCESCEIKEGLLKRSKEHIRSLKFQLQQLKDRLHTTTNKKFSRSMSNEQFEVSSHGIGGGGDEGGPRDIEALLQTISELEQGNSLLTSLLSAERKQHTDKETLFVTEVKARDDVIATLRQNLDMSENHRLAAESKSNGLVHELEGKCKEVENLEEEVENLRKEVTSLRLQCSEAAQDVERSVSNG